ncbi:leukotriene A-4 hydrol [Delitschia confertaspora ATCC 74209]|uniref:Leukotriene A(4) hydrolase n=1 Tax=Delitschia confertaspora ATCC 74209 TaxID=1513339 RepID=A0A9P4MPW1_9PLEO|nr:leukotriene A-4 hydrol [Delitschia confertaspora ATCC 74209]
MHRAPAAMVTRPAPDVTINTPRDPNTLSNYHNFRTRHTKAAFEIDFQKKILNGGVVLTLESLTEGESKEIVLDTSYLNVKAIKVDAKEVEWNIGERFNAYGCPLSIKLDHGIEKGKMVEVEITLSTTENCTALQWMSPAQTSNKKHPYMFSQCQAIHARSVFPCQDTPDVKSTFDFEIRSPLPVVASGLPTGSRDYEPGSNGAPGTLLYTFSQRVPIPSYLFALASGDLASASIGPRSTVWTGPEELLACQRELDGEIEQYMMAIESVISPPYAWTQYNALILPASFPYGGMENPVWTFATPSIISGDKQNVDVIAHELSHSWSGNLVTSCSWEHFWLNEGWTTYLERRIQGYLHGDAHFHFSSIIGWKALEDSVERFGADHEFTKLVVDLKGEDPDDAFSSVPYEKGFAALFTLDNLLGRKKWDQFIPHYFETFKFRSLDSYEFKACLIDFFAKDEEASKKLQEFDWDKLLYTPGLPPKPEFDDSLVKVCFKLAESWKNLAKDSKAFKPAEGDIEGWVANQSVVFLEKVQGFAETLSPDLVKLMGKTYQYDQSQNIELVSRYYSIGLKARYQEVYGPAAELLGKIGRMKFVRPLFRLLNEADRDLAVKTFEQNKDFYHPICRAMVEKDLFGDK